MSEQQDHRIVEVLRHAAPPVRDPAFRLRVLERREQRQFKRRLYIMLAGMTAILLVSAVSITLCGAALEMTGAPAAVVAATSACLAFRHSLAQVLRHFRI